MATNTYGIQVARTIGEIKEMLDELASNPRDYDTCKLAAEIYHIAHQLEGKRICPICGCDIDVWEEQMHEQHVCYGTEVK